MGRPQIQEEAVVQLADLIMETNQPDWPSSWRPATSAGWRGVKDMESKMINSVMRGVQTRSAPRFLALIPANDTG
jgi:GTP cyclohydrolase I